jgi:hypothetical protein
MGAGWVNELIARLTDTPVSDETCTNRTLDSNEETFPQGGKRFFVVCEVYMRFASWRPADQSQDFSHDNEMIEIMTVINIIGVSLHAQHIRDFADDNSNIVTCRPAKSPGNAHINYPA